jgi:hypothetical protein
MLDPQVEQQSGRTWAKGGRTSQTWRGGCDRVIFVERGVVFVLRPVVDEPGKHGGLTAREKEGKAKTGVLQAENQRFSRP